MQINITKIQGKYSDFRENHYKLIKIIVTCSF
jgi:hypothetical protein